MVRCTSSALLSSAHDNEAVRHGLAALAALFGWAKAENRVDVGGSQPRLNKLVVSSLLNHLANVKCAEWGCFAISQIACYNAESQLLMIESSAHQACLLAIEYTCHRVIQSMKSLPKSLHASDSAGLDLTPQLSSLAASSSVIGEACRALRSMACDCPSIQHFLAERTQTIWVLMNALVLDFKLPSCQQPKCASNSSLKQGQGRQVQSSAAAPELVPFHSLFDTTLWDARMQSWPPAVSVDREKVEGEDGEGGGGVVVDGAEQRRTSQLMKGLSQVTKGKAYLDNDAAK
jgi:hypothetical protein